MEDKIIEAFELMWGNYPAPVMLLSKKHDIVAVNKLAETYGVPLGIKCHSLSPGTDHGKYCKAAEAFKTGTGTRNVCKIEEHNKILDSFWVPVSAGDGYLLHFSNDITEYADKSLFSL